MLSFSPCQIMSDHVGSCRIMSDHVWCRMWWWTAPQKGRIASRPKTWSSCLAFSAGWLLQGELLSIDRLTDDFEANSCRGWQLVSAVLAWNLKPHAPLVLKLRQRTSVYEWRIGNMWMWAALCVENVFYWSAISSKVSTETPWIHLAQASPLSWQQKMDGTEARETGRWAAMGPWWNLPLGVLADCFWLWSPLQLTSKKLQNLVPRPFGGTAASWLPISTKRIPFYFKVLDDHVRHVKVLHWGTRWLWPKPLGSAQCEHWTVHNVHGTLWHIVTYRDISWHISMAIWIWWGAAKPGNACQKTWTNSWKTLKLPGLPTSQKFHEFSDISWNLRIWKFFGLPAELPAKLPAELGTSLEAR